MNLKTIREAAAALEISEGVVRGAVRRGELNVMTLGNRMLVDIDEARVVLAKQEGVKIEAVSAETGLTLSAIYRGVREGWIPYTKPGRSYLFDIDAVRAAIEQRMRKVSNSRK